MAAAISSLVLNVSNNNETSMIPKIPEVLDVKFTTTFPSSYSMDESGDQESLSSIPSFCYNNSYSNGKQNFNMSQVEIQPCYRRRVNG